MYTSIHMCIKQHGSAVCVIGPDLFSLMQLVTSIHQEKVTDMKKQTLPE